MAYSKLCISVQRAACDAYGIIVNVLTSDQHNWCVCLYLVQNLQARDSFLWLEAVKLILQQWGYILCFQSYVGPLHSELDSSAGRGKQWPAMHALTA